MNNKKIKNKYNISLPYNSNKLENTLNSLFNSKKINLELYDLNDSNVLFLIAIYYEKIENNIELTIDFYEKSIKLGNIEAINNLGVIYFNNANYEKMKEYFLLGIKYLNSNCMYNLGVYYYLIEKNTELMEKFYSHSFNLGNKSALYALGNYYFFISFEYEKMLNLFNLYNEDEYVSYMLGLYYESICINYTKMEKFYISSAKKGMVDSMVKLGNYYYTIGKYESMKYYYNMAADKDNILALFYLGFYYQFIEINYNKMKNYYIKAIFLGDDLNSLNNLNIYYNTNPLFQNSKK